MSRMSDGSSRYERRLASDQAGSDAADGGSLAEAVGLWADMGGMLVLRAPGVGVGRTVEVELETGNWPRVGEPDGDTGEMSGSS